MSSTSKCALVAGVAACAFSAAIAQTEHAVYIDPISNNGPANWNNLSFGVSNNTAVLKDSLTNSTGIRATVTVNLQSGANNNATTTPTGDAAEFAPAGGNSVYGNLSTWGTPPRTVPYGEVVFSNLNSRVAYHFTFYASRLSVTDIRDALYTVTGSTSASTVLNASTNVSRVASVSNIFPRVDGTITLRMEKGPLNNNSPYYFYYLTAMKVVYTDPPPTTLYVDVAGASAATGWNLLRMVQNSLVTLADTNGVSSGIRALVTTPFTNEGAHSTEPPVGSAAEFAPAGNNECYSANTLSSYATFYGMNPNIAYTFTFYAQRAGVTDTRETTYALSGATSGSATLDASSNSQNVAVVAGVLPKADGTITLHAARGTNNSGGFIYLTAFKITFVDNGLAYTLSDISGKRLLYFGNEYSTADGVPGLVADLAEAGGYPRPLTISDLATGRTLADQIARVDSYPDFNVNHPALIGTNTWDQVIIQGHGDESSSLGNVAAFRTNALALYQKVKYHASGKGAGAASVLFQTWARGTGSAVYPVTFADPAAMQAEIRSNTETASNNIAAAESAASVRLAYAGDAFGRGGFDPAMLYAADLSNPANVGPELAALMLYKSIYDATVTGIPYDAAISAGLSLAERDWIRTTCWADGLTPPEPSAPSAGTTEVILLDTAPNSDSAVYLGWNYMSFHTAGNSVQLALTNGYQTAATCTIATRLNYSSSNSTTNLTGDAAQFILSRANNSYGNVNPFGSYSNAYCEAVFSGLNQQQSYTFTLFGSRTGVTAGISRETRYTLTGSNSGSIILETANNTSAVAVVAGIRPAADGTITLRIEPGPNNNTPELFYHINALKIETVHTGLLLSVR